MFLKVIFLYDVDSALLYLPPFLSTFFDVCHCSQSLFMDSMLITTRMFHTAFLLSIWFSPTGGGLNKLGPGRLKKGRGPSSIVLGPMCSLGRLLRVGPCLTRTVCASQLSAYKTDKTDSFVSLLLCALLCPYV